jgi:hypothetical protein
MNSRLLRPRASGGFNPKSLSGLTLWLDAADASTVVLDANSRVSQWNDKSGFGRNFTQSNAVVRARYNAKVNGKNAINSIFAESGGNPVVTRTGVTNADFGGATSATVFIVFNLVSTIEFYNISSFGDAANNLDRFNSDSRTYSSRLRGTRSAGILMGMPTTGTVIFGTVANSGTSTQTWRRQGSQVASDADSYSGWRSATNQTWQFNSGTGASNILHCETIFYNRALTATELSVVEAYLLRKWAP